MNKTDKEASDFDFLIDVIAPAIGLTSDQLRDDMVRHHAKRKARIQRSNQLYADALNELTDKQTDIITKREADGWKINKVWQNKVSFRTAVMLVKKPIWDSSKNRLGTKLAMVYPDGSITETFERSVTVKQEF